jgi:Fis family transcriptional regulator
MSTTESIPILEQLAESACRIGLSYQRWVRVAKAHYLRALLVRHRGYVCKAARELGVHRNTLQQWLDDAGVNAIEIRIAHRKKRPASARIDEGRREVIA